MRRSMFEPLARQIGTLDTSGLDDEVGEDERDANRRNSDLPSEADSVARQIGQTVDEQKARATMKKAALKALTRIVSPLFASLGRIGE